MQYDYEVRAEGEDSEPHLIFLFPKTRLNVEMAIELHCREEVSLSKAAEKAGFQPIFIYVSPRSNSSSICFEEPED